MKWILFLLIMAACKPSKTSADGSGECVSGTLVVKGICGQRVIAVNGDAGDVLVEKAWLYPGSKDSLRNVFSVANICDFPAHIDSGAVVKFKLSKKPASDCITCKAYTPVPEVSNVVEVCTDVR